MSDIASFLDFLESRKTIRNFIDQQIDDQDILQILEAARWAPSAKNSQPWEFIVIKDKDTIGKVAETAIHAATLKNAPTLIAVVKKMENQEEWLSSQLAYEQSVSCAGMLMLLAIHQMGLGAYWVNVDRAKCSEVLGIPWPQADIAYVLGLGYVDMDKEARVFFDTPEEQRRKNILDSSYLNKYGNKLVLKE